MIEEEGSRQQTPDNNEHGENHERGSQKRQQREECVVLLTPHHLPLPLVGAEENPLRVQTQPARRDGINEKRAVVAVEVMVREKT